MKRRVRYHLPYRRRTMCNLLVEAKRPDQRPRVAKPGEEIPENGFICPECIDQCKDAIIIVGQNKNRLERTDGT